MLPYLLGSVVFCIIVTVGEVQQLDTKTFIARRDIAHQKFRFPIESIPIKGNEIALPNMHIYAFAIKFFLSNLSLNIPPRIDEDKPKTERIKALDKAN